MRTTGINVFKADVFVLLLTESGVSQYFIMFCELSQLDWCCTVCTAFTYLFKLFTTNNET